MLFRSPLFTKDQARVDVLLNATTRRDVTGLVIGVIGVGQDITERKVAEQEKSRVAKELQTFIDTANAPIFEIADYLDILKSRARVKTIIKDELEPEPKVFYLKMKADYNRYITEFASSVSVGSCPGCPSSPVLRPLLRCSSCWRRCCPT